MSRSHIFNVSSYIYITDKMAALLTDEKRKSAVSQLEAQERFVVEYKLDARNLCSEFREDIQFRFSFSPASLLSRYMGRDVSVTAFFNTPSFIVSYSLS